MVNNVRREGIISLFRIFMLSIRVFVVCRQSASRVRAIIAAEGCSQRTAVGYVARLSVRPSYRISSKYVRLFERDEGRFDFFILFHVSRRGRTNIISYIEVYIHNIVYLYVYLYEQPKRWSNTIRIGIYVCCSKNGGERIEKMTSRFFDIRVKDEEGFSRE